MVYAIAGLTFSLILFMSPIKIYISFKKKSSDEYIKIQTVYLGMIKFNLAVPRFFLKIRNFVPILKFNIKAFVQKHIISEGEVVTSPSDYKFRVLIFFLQNALLEIKKFNKLFKFFLKTVHVLKLELSCGFGLEDPANTGILTGGIYSAVYITLIFLSSYLDLSETSIKVEVKPHFLNAEPLEIDLYSIIRVRVGHIIIASFTSLVFWMSARRRIIKKIKGARVHGRTSYRKSDKDSYGKY